MNYNRCLYKQHWCFYRSFCTLKEAKKAGNMEQNTYQPPCLVSAHAQTLNEYPDTKKQIQMFSSQIIIRIIGYLVPALFIIMYLVCVTVYCVYDDVLCMVCYNVSCNFQEAYGLWIVQNLY